METEQGFDAVVLFVISIYHSDDDIVMSGIATISLLLSSCIITICSYTCVYILHIIYIYAILYIAIRRDATCIDMYIGPQIQNCDHDSQI